MNPTSNYFKYWFELAEPYIGCDPNIEDVEYEELTEDSSVEPSEILTAEPLILF